MPRSIRKAYHAYLEARLLPTSKNETGEHCYTPQAIQEMQQAILSALKAKGTIPKEMRLHLAFAFEEVCSGINSDLLAPVKRGGGRERPIAKHMQADAIRYLRWVENGRITDERPTATVAEAYGVTGRTVRGWKEAWREMPTPRIIEELATAETVARVMRASGKQYHRFVKKPISHPQSGRLKANR
jgi:hypothetical protein